MKNVLTLLSCTLIASLSTTMVHADTPQNAENSPAISNADLTRPMSLDETKTETTSEKPSSSGGFWIFPDQAPLTGSIATDRPGFSDSAGLVPRGRFQIESGYTFSYDREDDRRVIDHTMPEIALRTGLTDCLEFRAKWNGYSYSEVLDRITTPAGRHIDHIDHIDGGSDMTLGIKVPLLRQKECLPNVSMIASLGVPTGSDSKSANNVVPEIKFPWNYALTKELTIYGSLLGRVNDGSNGQFFQTAATVAAGYQVCSRATLYLEYFGVYPGNRSEDSAHILSAGPIFKITDNISMDMRAAVGLNEQAPDFQASVGFGIRF
ncbi:MAG: transporter [Planctomycetes bacterium]|nr:transporter [Planctomycetota bacterium]